MAWYNDWFGKEYLELYAHRDEEEAKLHTDLLLGSIAPVSPQRMLDIACGAGRHLNQLLQRGISAYGVDLSLELLRKYEGRQARVIQADMRALPFKTESFDAVTSFFTSFGYFETDAEHLELLQEWRRVLSKGGHLYIDYLNREQLLSTLVANSERRVGTKTVREQRSITKDGTRVEKRIRIRDDETNTEDEFIESVRVYSREEMEQLLLQAGFRLKSVYGDMHGGTHSGTSPRLILLALREENQ